jgi:hypothetical protein
LSPRRIRVDWITHAPFSASSQRSTCSPISPEPIGGTIAESEVQGFDLCSCTALRRRVAKEVKFLAKSLR